MVVSSAGREREESRGKSRGEQERAGKKGEGRTGRELQARGEKCLLERAEGRGQRDEG